MSERRERSAARKQPSTSGTSRGERESEATRRAREATRSDSAIGAVAGTKAGAPARARVAAISEPAGSTAGTDAGTKAGAPKARLGEGGRVNLDPESTRNGVAQLVLALINFLHELLERQAVRRMEAGSLSDEEIERLGIALMKQAEELKRLAKEFGLEDEDLNLDLGPLGKLV